MEKELTGEGLGGWKLAECIGHGKSALVFRASKGSLPGAVKVFNCELVEKFGRKRSASASYARSRSSASITPI